MTDSKGGHSSQFDPTSLDANQRGIAQNTIDEEKSNYGAKTAVDRDVGGKMPTSKVSTGAYGLPEISSGGQSLSDIVNEALKGRTGMAQDKAQRIDESMKVGGDEDLHEMAAAKQP
ncbi:uncharacterized protein Z520_05608 [Fonsecaea multimorphosa CBS 102226]|uniref:Uncharacterized protein n=1 Tax=Fonsecaea multimorphosa CBS 102226 TaxID=1442371 RepID=A0A0D2JXN2_9EURO|nr:uncharacterized protein Z520_05608 [Fonsecaea multimorphosa CBS 102226]KIX98307.1 hypothetical protein Z520_05608 [Fonsecaea multimorphosa CBS 102226]OAL24502.1 hypothetical protein AYO22_05291 [Fonsecaea multimorphosa]